MPDNKTRYINFCTSCPQLPVFFQHWYLDSVCEDGNWDVILSEKDGVIAGVMPFFMKKKWGFSYITMPHFTKHLGPFISPSYERYTDVVAIQQDLIHQLPKVASFKQDFHPSINNWLPFFWEGFQSTVRYTYVIDLKQGLEQIETKINRNMRRNIKKAVSQLEVTSNGTLEDFFEMNQKSFGRQGISLPYSFDLFKEHDKVLEKHNARKMFFARDISGNVHSAAYLIWDNHRAYYHLSGDDPAFRSSGSGILLIWKAIEFASKTLQLETFDFEGSMLPQVEAIRRQFGAVQTPYFRVWDYKSKAFFLMDHFKQGLKMLKKG